MTKPPVRSSGRKSRYEVAEEPPKSAEQTTAQPEHAAVAALVPIKPPPPLEEGEVVDEAEVESVPPPAAAAASQPDPETMTCPECAEKSPRDALNCAACGKPFAAKKDAEMPPKVIVTDPNAKPDVATIAGPPSTPPASTEAPNAKAETRSVAVPPIPLRGDRTVTSKEKEMADKLTERAEAARAEAPPVSAAPTAPEAAPAAPAVTPAPASVALSTDKATETKPAETDTEALPKVIVTDPKAKPDVTTKKLVVDKKDEKRGVPSGLIVIGAVLTVALGAVFFAKPSEPPQPSAAMNAAAQPTVAPTASTTAVPKPPLLTMCVPMTSVLGKIYLHQDDITRLRMDIDSEDGVKVNCKGVNVVKNADGTLNVADCLLCPLN